MLRITICSRDLSSTVKPWHATAQTARRSRGEISYDASIALQRQLESLNVTARDVLLPPFQQGVDRRGRVLQAASSPSITAVAILSASSRRCDHPSPGVVRHALHVHGCCIALDTCFVGRHPRPSRLPTRCLRISDAATARCFPDLQKVNAMVWVYGPAPCRIRSEIASNNRLRVRLIRLGNVL